MIVQGLYPPCVLTDDHRVTVPESALTLVRDFDVQLELLPGLRENQYGPKDEVLRALFDTFGPSKLLWGSEFTKVKCAMTSRVDQADIERGLREIAMRVGRIGDAEIRWMRSRDLFSVVRRVYESRYRDSDAVHSYPEDVPDAASLAARYDAVVHDLRELQRTGGTVDRSPRGSDQ